MSARTATAERLAGPPVQLAADPEANWRDAALCAQVDGELFFPEKGGSVREPKSVCRNCPVTGQCLEYALENNVRWGVWGGLSERERNRLTRNRAR